MYGKAFLGIVAAALAIACFGAGTSSAATLYTNSAYTTAVPVGTTITASIAEPGLGEYGYKVTTNGVNWTVCKKGSYTFKVTQNSGGTFKAAIASGSFVGCGWLVAPEVANAELQVTGSSTAVGTSKAWLGASMLAVQSLNGRYYFGQFSGATGNPPANGLSVQQPGAGAPVSVVLSNAVGLNGPDITGGKVTATYTLTGTAAGYSFN